MRERRAGISLYPKLEGFFGLLQVPSDHLMVPSRDEVLLRLAGSVAEFVSFSGTLNIHTEFTHIVVCEAHPYVSECETRVEFDGLLIKRNSRSIPGSHVKLETRTEGFQGFQRRGGRLFERSIEFLHRAQRLAQIVTNVRSCLSQSVEHVTLLARLGLGASHRFPTGAVDRLKGQKILRANLGNRTIEDDGARCPLAEFPGNVGGELGVRFLAHHLQGLLDLLIGDNAEERRLFQLYGKPLPQRAVENGVAGRVCKVREDNRVLVRKFWRAVKIEVACDEQRQHYCDAGNNHFPMLCDARRGRGPRTGCDAPGICVALQTAEVGTNLRSMLVAQVAIFLQALGDDAL